MTDDRALTTTQAAARVPVPDDLPKWIRPFTYRLGQLKAPGVYRILLVVGEDGTRSLAIENPYEPIRAEALATK